MIKPTLHLNGTSKASLAACYRIARDELAIAIKSLTLTAPNGRDYYPQGPEAMEASVSEHRSRLKRVDDVIEELNELIAHCDGD